MFSKRQCVLILAIMFVFSLLTLNTHAFIERTYTVSEILDACTNIVYGKVKSVDTTRLTAIIEVEENVKGQSNLTLIKMNFGIGQRRPESTPEKMVKLLEVGKPIIVFYEQQQAINSLGYVSGKWFQTRSNAPEGWWGFTHLDPYMARTFRGTTKEFQKVVRKVLAGEEWIPPEIHVKMLVLRQKGASSNEDEAIKKIRKAGGCVVNYEVTDKRSLPGLDKVHLLWIGYREISDGGSYFFNETIEEKIKKFVFNGGVVIVSGQDSDPDRPCGTGWLVGELTGVDRSTHQDFYITDRGRTLMFETPNHIESGQLIFDDAWMAWDGRCEPLATTTDGQNLVVGARRHGEGMYIITSMYNRDATNVARNEKLIQNLLHYAAIRAKI